MLRNRIRDPVPFWPLDPGSGMVKKSGSGYVIRIRDEQPGSYFRELLRIRIRNTAIFIMGFRFRYHIFVRYETERTDAPWIVQKNTSRLAMKDFLFVLLWARWNKKVFYVLFDFRVCKQIYWLLNTCFMCFIRDCCSTVIWNMILVIVVSHICLKGDRFEMVN